MLLRSSDHRSLIKIEQVVDEFVRVLDLDSKWSQPILWKVTFIERDDHAGTAPDSSGKDMMIIRVR